MPQKHAIRLPGLLLDELKAKEYENDERFATFKDNKKGGKRIKKQVSRKERRKQQRLDKKHTGKRVSESKTENGHQRKLLTANEQKNWRLPKTEEKRSKANAKFKSKAQNDNFVVPPDDELSSDDFEDFKESDLEEEEWEQLRELERDEEATDHDLSESQSIEYGKDEISDHERDSSHESEDDESQGEMTVEETMEALKVMKEKKKAQQDLSNKNSQQPKKRKISEDSYSEKEDRLNTIKVKEDKVARHHKTNKEKGENRSDTPIDFPVAPADRAAMERDEMDMQYYAKKLGLKGKSKKIHARDEYDAIGGLLDGLDFFESYGGNDEEYGEYGRESEKSSDEQGKGFSTDSENENADLEKLPTDDELSSGDFEEFDEDDLNEEEWEQLRELEDSGDEGNKKRENPLVAPVEEGIDSYVPPSLRKKVLDTENLPSVVLEIKKHVKSLLNKLSDSNITLIISSLNALYNKYARHYVTETIATQIVEIVGQKSKVLDSFIMNYSAVMYSLWKLRGNEAGAFFIQFTVERFLNDFEEGMRKSESQETSEGAVSVFSKESSNILGLLAYTYNFGLISCNLIYDLIRLLVGAPNEFTTELLLKVISISGPLIRGDDASALKDIITQLLANVKSLKQQSPRLKFLLDTMADLKNNRLKPSLLAASHQGIKKTLQGAFKVEVGASEPLLVSLEDIKNVEKKGKWWLVGASWKGNTQNEMASMGAQPNNSDTSKDFIIEDDLLDDIPDWNEIAKQQRMNTDVRRAIFISIMSAQDYMDAFGKLEKLNLKNKQLMEIPRVLLHCLSQDSGATGYNPYYALLALKLCDHQHVLGKSFQFLFWDEIKTFEDEISSDIFDEDDSGLREDARLSAIANKGRFFGYLVAERVLQLDIFKHVPLLTGLVPDGIIFIELLLFQFLLTTGKKSEIKGRDSTGKRIVSYNDDMLSKLIENGVKLENRAIILKGLLYFVKKNMKYKKFIQGPKGSKAYERDLRRMEWSVHTFIDTLKRKLENAII